jgi:hypothetical protein
VRRFLPVLALAVAPFFASREARAEAALEMETRYVHNRLALGDVAFRMNGVPQTLGAPQLGLGTVSLHGGEIAFLGRGDRLAFGPVFGVSGGTAQGGLGPTAYDGLLALRVAVEGHAFHRVRDWTFDASVAVGGRFVSLQPATLPARCSPNSAESNECGAVGNAAMWSLVPRLQATWQPGLGDAKYPILGTGVGAFVGTDVLRPGSYEVGLTLSFRVWLVPPGKTWNEMTRLWEAEQKARCAPLY